MLERSSIILGMNTLSADTKATILRCLTDGMSVRATSRLTKASKGAILRLLEEAGTFAAFYQSQLFWNLTPQRVEADEIWSFVRAKQRNATHQTDGDLYTFCAIDADSKLVFSWFVGPRDDKSTHAFVADVARRVTGRIQFSTDGWSPYVAGVRKAFRAATVDYGMIVKQYGKAEDQGQARRYSPAVCTGVLKESVVGAPDRKLISTSYVERLNLDTRQNCRRFTRLTNAHSKKAENHAYAVALNFLHHNFLKVHGSLTKKLGEPTTPAMYAGLAKASWTFAELVERMDPKGVTIK